MAYLQQPARAVMRPLAAAAAAEEEAGAPTTPGRPLLAPPMLRVHYLAPIVSQIPLRCSDVRDWAQCLLLLLLLLLLLILLLLLPRLPILSLLPRLCLHLQKKRKKGGGGVPSGWAGGGGGGGGGKGKGKAKLPTTRSQYNHQGATRQSQQQVLPPPPHPPRMAPKPPPSSTWSVADPFAAGAAGRAGLGAAAADLTLQPQKPGKGAAGADSAPQQPPGYSAFTKARARVDKDFGKFEKHTKGIGAKLLSRMGWREGEGLGVARHGIARPIEVTLRRRGAGLQDRGERSQQGREDFGEQDSEEEEEAAFRQQLGQWRAGPEARSKKRRPKYTFKSAAEVAEASAAAAAAVGGAEGAAVNMGPSMSAVYDMGTTSTPTFTSSSSSSSSTMKIVDLAGREYDSVVESVRAATTSSGGYDGGSGSGGSGRSSSSSNVPMPELQHNLGLLVEFAEQDIGTTTSALGRARHASSGYVRERERIAALHAAAVARTRRLEGALGLVDMLTERAATVSLAVGSTGDSLPPDECAALLGTFRKDYAREYNALGLAALAVPLVFPALERRLAAWQPLDEPHAMLDTFTLWSQLLLPTTPDVGENGGDGKVVAEPPPAAEVGAPLTPHQRLCWEVFLPRLRTALQRDWDVRIPGPAVALVSAWVSVLPPWVAWNIKEQLVLPRLKTALDDWSPRSDPMPVHLWLHPWLPVLPGAIAGLLPDLRRKLVNGLQTWHPSDASALAVLGPWQDAFSEREMQDLLERAVVPKLADTLAREFDAPPLQPEGGVPLSLRWTLAWEPLLSAGKLATLLDCHVLPKLLRCLCKMLSHTVTADGLRDVASWYRSWRSTFSPRLCATTLMKLNLYRALDLMRRATPGFNHNALDEVRERLANMSTSATVQSDDAPAAVRRMPRSAVPGSLNMSAPRNLKEFLQQRADAAGVLFMPKPGRSHKGKLLYQIGNRTAYFDQDVVFSRHGSAKDFVPTAIDALFVDPGA